MSEIIAVTNTLQAILACDSRAAQRIAETEMTLAVLEKFSPDTDPTKAYKLLCNYSLLGTRVATAEAAFLQKAHSRLKKYSSKKAWLDAIDEYRRAVYDNIRLYEIKDTADGVFFERNTRAIPAPDRLNKYIAEIEKYEPKRASKTTDAGYYTYRIHTDPLNSSEKKIHIPKKHTFKPAKSSPKGRRGIITVAMSELVKAAEEMHRLYEDDHCHKFFSPESIKLSRDNKLVATDTLELSEVVNMVGMVSAGKSTLIKILSFYLAKKDCKIVIVAETVTDVFDLCGYFRKLGINASPLIGKGERMKYLSQLYENKKMFVESTVSEYLCGACIVEGMSVGETVAEYGDEPCYSLKKGDKYHTCPYFDECPSTKMHRDALTSNIVMTTAAGLAASKVGVHKQLFLQYAMEQADLVIIDECDKVQSTLDNFFTPETAFLDFVHNNADKCSKAMRKSIAERQINANYQYLDELIMKSDMMINVLSNAINRMSGAWKRLTEDTFSSGTLFDRLEYDGVPENVLKMLEKALHRPERSEQALLFREACLSTDDTVFRIMLCKELDSLNYSPDEETLSHIMLYLVVAGFDEYLRKIDSEHSLYSNDEDELELYNFLRSRFTAQQKLLPSSAMGNLFGMRNDKEKGVILYRQYAFGRAVMTRMPWLSLSDSVESLGPNVLLLSGSCFAKGCFEYHVNVPVKYIIETEPKKLEHLMNTEITELGITDRISGSHGEMREHKLQTVLSACVDSIRAEFERNDGKLLLIVNSYSEAKKAHKYLEQLLKPYSLNETVAHLIRPDDGKSGNDKVARSDITTFGNHPAKILIAPAAAIERGYNIVDEIGHSVFGSVFFIVRPISNFTGISRKISKINGMVDAHFNNALYSNEYEFCSDLRKYAVQHFSELTRASYIHSLAQLPYSLKKDQTAVIFITLLQIVGRLARIADYTKAPPRVYFADGSFRGSGESGYDCLNELITYLDELMNDEESGHIAGALYAPFYTALKKGIRKNAESYTDIPDVDDTEDEYYC